MWIAVWGRPKIQWMGCVKNYVSRKRISSEFITTKATECRENDDNEDWTLDLETYDIYK